jgi:hypothetical protein
MNNDNKKNEIKEKKVGVFLNRKKLSLFIEKIWFIDVNLCHGVFRKISLSRVANLSASFTVWGWSVNFASHNCGAGFFGELKTSLGTPEIIWDRLKMTLLMDAPSDNYHIKNY